MFKLPMFSNFLFLLLISADRCKIPTKCEAHIIRRVCSSNGVHSTGRNAIHRVVYQNVKGSLTQSANKPTANVMGTYEVCECVSRWKAKPGDE